MGAEAPLTSPASHRYRRSRCRLSHRKHHDLASSRPCQSFWYSWGPVSLECSHHMGCLSINAALLGSEAGVGSTAADYWGAAPADCSGGPRLGRGRRAASSNKVNVKKVLTAWPDMLWVAGSPVIDQARDLNCLDLLQLHGLRAVRRASSPARPGRSRSRRR